MPPLLLPSHPTPAMVAESNGGITDGGLTSKLEVGKGGGSERGSPIEKYMRPSKPSSYSPPGSPIEKYQYPLLPLPLPLTLSPDLTPESDWLRFWTKYKMAATSGVPGSISNLSSPSGIGNNAHHLGTMVTPVQYHQQSYTVPYCASPYSPLPPPPAPAHYPPPPPHHAQTLSSASPENDTPLDLAIRQRDTSNANMYVSNGAERKRKESPRSETSMGNWKGEKEREEMAEEGKHESSIVLNCAKADAATQDDLANRCTHCGIYFLDEVMYALHMSCHGDKEPYQCGFCLHVCADRYDFTTHIQRGLHKTLPPPQQQDHTPDGKSLNVMAAPECRSQTPAPKDGGITSEDEEVMSTDHDGQEKEDTDSGSIQEVEKEQERSKELCGKTSLDDQKSPEITTVAESMKLDGLTDGN